MATKESAAAATAAATVVGNDIAWIKKDTAEIKATLKEISGAFATKDEVGLIQKLVFGLITADIAIVGWLVSIALKK